MEITVNGEKQKLDGQVTVAQLLEKLGIDPVNAVKALTQSYAEASRW